MYMAWAIEQDAGWWFVCLSGALKTSQGNGQPYNTIWPMSQQGGSECSCSDLLPTRSEERGVLVIGNIFLSSRYENYCIIIV